MKKKARTVLITGALVLFVGFTAGRVQAQAIGKYELASSKVASPLAASSAAAGPTNAALEEQITAQQNMISSLEQRIQKMEAALEAQANLQPATSAASLVADSLLPPSATPDPAPAPAIISQPRTARELLPDIGQIGAEVGVLVGAAQNPFKANDGFIGAGFIDLPLKKFDGGKLSYEILAGLQRSTTTVTTTSSVLALVNAIANVELGTPPSFNNLSGPLPITNTGTERQTVLSVVPFSFKYTVTRWDRWNLRPYVVGGLGTYVALSTQKNNNTFDATAIAGLPPSVAALLNTLLQGPQVAGLAPEAPELRERGVAAGQGDFRFGLHVGGGLEYRASSKFSMGFDYRYNKPEGRNSAFSSFSITPAFHF